MTLPDLVLRSRANQRWRYSGLDSPEHARDLAWFYSYPWPVEYCFNSRGFRDSEWPQDLVRSIWCVGDSFTVGLGQTLSHIWPQVLQARTGQRTINVSMDGASNDWIARRIKDIVNAATPKVLIVQWSFVHRRERCPAQAQQQQWQDFYRSVRDPSWPDCPSVDQIHTLPHSIQHEIQTLHSTSWQWVSDEDLRLEYERTTDQQDLENLASNIQKVNDLNADTKIIHSFIPGFAPATVDVSEILSLPALSVGQVQQQDRARDGIHYDLITAESLVHSLLQLL